ncbi:YqaJ viral recombinase family protein [Corynebacterium pseudopelargi]|uniref:YqaJ viral recombinase domain-containing protein n=1 Tax=Corynebacterium pseudopelargi TaxID=2080757 RepID=A0A3G6ISV3_9CORY|nr:YqaJ viral recombinase family protein [Corynebacterium pseudopelargi]AZA08731.1 hypothetical protein CPPEL_03000 [Corynebacterium pseudopelargi]
MSTIVKNPPKPGTPEWQQLITASKVPIILGLSPHQTRGELWTVMSGLAEPAHLEGDHLDFGHDIEDGLVNSWKRKNPGWRTNSTEIAYKDETLPFPNLVTLDRRAVRGRAFAIIECKASSSNATWGAQQSEYSPNDLPPVVAAQVLAQQGISGIHQAHVVALVGYDKPLSPRHYEAAWDADLWDAIVHEIDVFYKSLGDAEPPAPSQDVIDALLAAQGSVGEGKTEAQAELATHYFAAKATFEQAKADLDQAQADLVGSMGDLKALTWDGKTLVSKQAGRFSQSNVPEEYRHLLKTNDVLTPKFDAKKFKAKHPDLYQAATGAPTTRFYQ